MTDDLPGQTLLWPILNCLDSEIALAHIRLCMLSSTDDISDDPTDGSDDGPSDLDSTPERVA